MLSGRFCFRVCKCTKWKIKDTCICKFKKTKLWRPHSSHILLMHMMAENSEIENITLLLFHGFILSCMNGLLMTFTLPTII